MTITLTLGSWLVPVAITLIAAAVVGIIAFIERNDTGWFAGLGAAFAAICALIAVICVWITFAAMKLIG